MYRHAVTPPESHSPTATCSESSETSELSEDEAGLALVESLHHILTDAEFTPYSLKRLNTQLRNLENTLEPIQQQLETWEQSLETIFNLLSAKLKNSIDKKIAALNNHHHLFITRTHQTINIAINTGDDDENEHTNKALKQLDQLYQYTVMFNQKTQAISDRSVKLQKALVESTKANTYSRIQSFQPLLSEFNSIAHLLVNTIAELSNQDPEQSKQEALSYLDTIHQNNEWFKQQLYAIRQRYYQLFDQLIKFQEDQKEALYQL